MGSDLTTDVTMAERHWRAELELTPDNAWLHAQLAQSLIALSRLEEAAHAAATAAQLAPQQLEPRLLLADAKLRLGGSRSIAKRAIDDSMRMAPDRPEPLVLLGRYWEAGGKDRKAHAAYRAALELSPHWPDALRGLARTSSAEGEKVEAARLAEQLDGGLDDQATEASVQSLSRQASTRILTLMLLVLSPVAVALAVGMSTEWPALLRGAVVFGVWFGGSFAVAWVKGPEIAQRWLDGRRTWWLLDGAIATGRYSRLRGHLVVLRNVGIIIVLIGVLITVALWAGRPPAIAGDTLRSDENPILPLLLWVVLPVGFAAGYAFRHRSR